MCLKQPLPLLTLPFYVPCSFLITHPFWLLLYLVSPHNSHIIQIYLSLCPLHPSYVLSHSEETRLETIPKLNSFGANLSIIHHVHFESVEGRVPLIDVVVLLNLN
ncbi:hypothetical protein JHK82_026751 [Glycine max]|uniref:Uncharacterized protein n=2 Tax=Glycine subgen. Soja TaxID=1462606 RepID=A0A0R0HXF9_SOYBN|nr:hypothetical protein JHK85_027370 [Glycine max]KAG5002736.1 hypothetical protein JHK86_026875 [Glycine max]KAG5125916.1 hypothetical protein JHK82_026751 [Glycine max]KAG5150510.1 hypothetical protein JHK84_026982 [Glycine max]RZB85388.1 hypothetical protein D0Y65_025826 [Glycine soja]